MAMFLPCSSSCRALAWWSHRACPRAALPAMGHAGPPAMAAGALARRSRLMGMLTRAAAAHRTQLLRSGNMGLGPAVAWPPHLWHLSVILLPPACPVLVILSMGSVIDVLSAAWASVTAALPTFSGLTVHSGPCTSMSRP